MQWSVVKTGAELFDLLHAYGLGVLLAHAGAQPTQMRDTGGTYTLTGHLCSPPRLSIDLIDEVLVLPALEQVEAIRQSREDLAVANLDGLLTILFTTPGTRVLSVTELARRSSWDDAVIEQALRKVRTALTRWKAFVSQASPKGAERFLEQILEDYAPPTLALPVPAEVRPHQDLSLVMMLDPAFSYSTHRPRSDGLVSQKGQVTIRGTDAAILLASIGAARFLRAHSVGGDLVNCYVPKAATIRLESTSRLPLLAPVETEATCALLVQWLTYALSPEEEGQACWKGLAYQTIQTQGTQQSIPRHHGCLDLTWLIAIQRPHRERLCSFWRLVLRLAPEQRPYELDALTDALQTRSLHRWIIHLLEHARHIHRAKDAMRPYTLEEVKEVTMQMNTSLPSLFKKILVQRAGTLRIGQALRLLGEVAPDALRDLIEELETVTTHDQLVHALALTAQACQVAAAKTRFIIVPTEDDVSLLCSDLEQASPHSIAGFLILLSAIRYPRQEETEADGRSPSAPEPPLQQEPGHSPELSPNGTAELSGQTNEP
jgi:hypothetical protein